jgi:hypothetical protein
MELYHELANTYGIFSAIKLKHSVLNILQGESGHLFDKLGKQGVSVRLHHHLDYLLRMLLGYRCAYMILLYGHIIL